jgi:cell division protein FtsI (penicillin-binding protein 3)
VITRGLKNLRGRTSAVQPGGFLFRRMLLVEAGIYVLFAIVIVRAGTLQIVQRESKSLDALADRQYQTSVEISPYRGAIMDRRGEPLAISIKKPSVAINPRVFEPTPTQLKLLERYLGLSKDEIIAADKRTGYFSWLKRKAPQEMGERIAALDIPGLHLVPEPARFYPAGDAAAHLIGLVGLENRGLFGIERSYNQDLSARKTAVSLARDARHKIIVLDSKDSAPEKPGNTIYLTIDRAIQDIAERALADGVANAKAKRGYAIVADPHTGRILGLANFPTFNLNSFKPNDLKLSFNHAAQATFEPGSITKPFVIARALEAKVVNEQSMFDCENGQIKVGKHFIRDTSKHKLLTVAETIIFSSNICTYKIANLLGKKGTYSALSDFGVGQKLLEVDSVSSAGGHIPNWEKWKEINFVNIAFGQGFVTTALELVSALGVIANGGLLLKPYLVDRVENADRVVLSANSRTVVSRVIKPETANRMRKIMAQVVTHPKGSGTLAKNPYYTIAGKTGTAQKADPNRRGYSATGRIASFVGITPANEPHLAIIVVVDEPGIPPYYGGKWAAPIVKEIAVESLRYLNVAPDIKPEVAQGETKAHGSKL